MTGYTYLDHNATTPVDSEVLDAMMPYLHEDYGNASSRHDMGRNARKAVDQAREEVADAVGAQPGEIVFTSSGTESGNAVIKGVAAMSNRQNVAVSAVEHPCILCAARSLQRLCFGYSPIAVDESGILDMNDLDQTLKTECALVSVMMANNETGVLQDIAEISGRVRESGAVMHTDAVQALGKMPVDFEAMGVDAMTLSAHKAYGPKGVAALVLRRNVSVAPLLDGGGQESGLRSGTENVPGIVGFGKAAQLAKSRAADMSRTIALRDRMEKKLAGLGGVVFGGNVGRLPNTSLIGFPGIDGESLVVMLDQVGFGLASGSACSSMKNEGSHVLLAMGVDPELTRSAVRISLGKGTDSAAIDALLGAVQQTVERMRSLSAVAV